MATVAIAILWVACAAAVITAAVRSRRDPGALRFGRRSVAILYLGAGAAVNAFFLARGDDYATFADGAYVAFTIREVTAPACPRGTPGGRSEGPVQPGRRALLDRRRGLHAGEHGAHHRGTPIRHQVDADRIGMICSGLGMTGIPSQEV